MSRDFINPSSCAGISSSTLDASTSGVLRKERKGTNWTMSRSTSACSGLSSSSASRRFMSVKSASPTPTMTMERGRRDARMSCSIVASMSLSVPSVRRRRMV